MPTNRLTDRACRGVTPKARPFKLFDGHGLYLLVKPGGAKLWQVAYRLNGRAQTASFGPYPEVTLAQARTKREALRTMLRDGFNPKEACASGRPPVAPARPAMTLRQAMQAYWDARGDVSAGYRQNATRAFEMHLTALLDEPLAAIDRSALMAELRKMDAARLFVYVRRVRMWAGQVFDWALEHHEQTGVTINPAAMINPDKAFGRAPVRSHPALALADMPDFMQRLAVENPAMQSVLACRLLALTWVRTQELRFMEWSELEHDGTLWRIPEGKMKRRFEHLVPLSKQARTILANMKERSGASNYVFPSDAGRRPDRPMSENAVLYLLGRIGYEGRMTGHGWRSVASTWANESGRYNRDAIERQLAHTDSDKVRAAYNRASYLAERTQMMQDWADWLDAVGSH